MPLYEYQCQACGERFEVIRKFSDPPLEQCARCGEGPIDRLVSSPAFQFKGSGWYVTDYAKKDKKAGGGATEKPDAKKDDAKKDDAKKGDAGSASSAKTDTSSTPASSTAAPATPAKK